MMEALRERTSLRGEASAKEGDSPWSPFRYSTFTVLWSATVVSNIGTWMQNAAAGWLMTGLNPDPLVVALVQVATSLPMFLFVLPAGALADIIDRRHLLLVAQIAAALIIAVLSMLIWADRVTPFILLAFTFLAGSAAALIGLPVAHFAAAAAAVAAIPLLWRWKLQTGAGVDLMPSMHWPTPVLYHEIEADRGPTLVTIEYRIDYRKREEFLAALERFAHERRRDGAYAWGVFEDAAENGRFLETFLVESWLEHLRQHERVTHADRLLQNAVQRFHLEGAPKVTHFIAAAPSEAHPPEEKHG